MMDTQNNGLQKKQELEKHEVQEVLKFLKNYGKLIGAGILAAAVTVAASQGYAHHKASRLAKAEQLLMEARTPEQLEEVLNKYGSTPAAPVALLSLAKTFYNNGDYSQARAQYDRFLKKHKKHDLRSSAELGLAYCTEADGDFNGAAAQFAAFAERNNGSYLQPIALLSVARCMEQAGRIDEARIVLEDFLAENGNSPWFGSAESALKSLNETVRKK